MGVEIVIGLTSVAFHEPTGITYDLSNSARGTCNWGVLGSKYTPVSGQRMSVYLNGDLRWGGEINVVEAERIGNPDIYDTLYKVTAVSWEVRLERLLVEPYVFSGMSGDDIVDYLMTTYINGCGISAGTINTGLTSSDIGILRVEGVTVAALLDEIASRNNLFWYVDPDLHLFMIPKGSISVGALDLFTENGNFKEPTITETPEDYCNAVHIKIGWDQIGSTPHTFTGDGSTTTFTLPNVSGVVQKIDHIDTIKLNGVPVNVGIYGVDTDKDAYYVIGDNKIYWDTALPVLGATDELEVNYYVLGRNIITYQDDDEIAARNAIEAGSGVYQHWIDDSNNSDQNGALAKAQAYIKKRCPGLNGAAHGTMPKLYTGTVFSFQPNASELTPGSVVQLKITNSPSTGGTKNIVIQSVKAKYQPYDDPVNVVFGYFDYTFQGIEYVEVQDGVEFFKQFLDRSGSNPQGSISSGGGTAVVSGGGGTSEVEVEEPVKGPRNGYNTRYQLTWVPHTSSATGNQVISSLHRGGQAMRRFTSLSQSYHDLSGGRYILSGRDITVDVPLTEKEEFWANYWTPKAQPTPTGAITRAYVHVRGSFYQNPETTIPYPNVVTQWVSYVTVPGPPPSTSESVSGADTETHSITLIGIDHASNTYAGMPNTAFLGDDSFAAGSFQTFERWIEVDPDIDLEETLESNNHSFSVSMTIGGTLFWISTGLYPDSQLKVWDVYAVVEYANGTTKTLWPQHSEVVFVGNRDLASATEGAGTESDHRTSGLSDASEIRFWDFKSSVVTVPSRINCGGPIYVDGSGHGWLADIGVIGGTAQSNGTTVTGTTDPFLYASYVQSSATLVAGEYEMSYNVSLQRGHYNFHLMYADPSSTGAGQRLFDVQIGALQVEANFDIWSEAGGANKAIVKSYLNFESNGGTSPIKFKSNTGRAIICAIYIEAI